MDNLGLTLEIKEKNIELKENINTSNNQIWNHEKIKESVKLLKNNEIYRIGDAINFKKDHKVIQKLLSDDIYNDTIGPINPEVILEGWSQNTLNYLHNYVSSREISQT